MLWARSSWRLLAISLLIGSSPAARRTLADAPPPAAVDLLVPIAAMDGTCKGPDDPDCHRTALTPEVGTALLRTEILAGIAPGQARLVRLSLLPKATLEAWVGAPGPLHGGRVRWPAWIEGEPSARLVIVGPSPTKPLDGGGTATASGPFVILVRSLRLGSFELTPLSADGSRVLVKRIDPRGALPCAVGATPGTRADAPAPRRCGCRSGAGPHAGPERALPPARAPAYRATSVATPGNVAQTSIDLLICYTPAALGSIGTGTAPAFEATLDAYVSLLNDALRACWSGAEIGSWSYKPVAYTYENAHPIPYIWQHHLRPATTTWIPEAHTERDAVGADLVTLIIYKNNALTAGYGDVWASNALPATQSEGAFSVVQASQLGNDTLIHEIGHNLGCCHELADPSNPAECSGPSYRHAFGFAPGSWGTATNGNPWATLMHTQTAPAGSGQPPYQRISWFSYPDICLVGYGCTALGDYATADNARMIREAAPSVAAYR